MTYKQKNWKLLLGLSIAFLIYMSIRCYFKYRNNPTDVIFDLVDVRVFALASVTSLGGTDKMYTIYALLYMIAILLMMQKCTAQRITKGTRRGYIKHVTLLVLLIAFLMSFIFNLVAVVNVHYFFSIESLWNGSYYIAQFLSFLHIFLCFYILGQVYLLLYVITQRSWMSTVLVLLGGIGIMTLDVPLLFYQVDVFENLYGTYSDHQLHFADWCWMMVRLGIVSCVLFEVSKRFFQRRSLLK